MINYARHDEEFLGVFKLISGEEILAKAVLTEDGGETLIFLQDPVCVQLINKEIGENKVMRGVGFAKWMQFSDEDFFILREKDVISVTSMSQEISIMYETYLISEGDSEKIKEETKVDLDPEMGYLGKIDEARSSLERIYNNPSHNK